MNATNLAHPHKRRSRRGSSIAEFAPALYFLLIVAFFPMVDLIGLLLSYADCQYLHFTLVRQAALENVLTLNTATSPASLNVDTSFVTNPSGTFQGLITGWYNGIGHFTTRSLNDISVQASVDLTVGSPTLKFVQVVTTVVCNPVVPIPFPIGLPGFNQPATFTMSGKSVIENVPS